MNKGYRTTLVAAGCIVVLAACGDRPADRSDGTAAGAPGAPAAISPAEQRYAPELGVDIAAMTRTPSGLYVQEVAEGTGAVAQSGDMVVVHYTGWLPDGREFDSSRGRGPFEFALDRGMVIAGWDEGVAGMREGGRRRLVIPSDLAYGPDGAGGVIPPNATLIFDVELLDVQ
jgi:FKBP-type peptidyl-prolyl cis-trans isomerase FkpA